MGFRFNEMEEELIHSLKNEYRYRKLLDSDKARFNISERQYYELCQKQAEDKIEKLLKDHKDLKENLKKLTYQVNDLLVFTLVGQKSIYHDLWMDLNKYLENYKLQIKTDKIFYYLNSMDLIDDKYMNRLVN